MLYSLYIEQVWIILKTIDKFLSKMNETIIRPHFVLTLFKISSLSRVFNLEFLNFVPNFSQTILSKYEFLTLKNSWLDLGLSKLKFWI
jgi:hypothetical protein